jgi:hypothetical protein
MKISNTHRVRARSEDFRPPQRSHADGRDTPRATINARFYFYCANHPHRRPDRDPIPIGPIMRDDGSAEGGRYVWIQSPDSGEVRLHLLGLLENIFERALEDRYPIGMGLAQTVIWQLGEFREDRAAAHVEWIRSNGPAHWADTASEALAKIREGDRVRPPAEARGEGGTGANTA